MSVQSLPVETTARAATGVHVVPDAFDEVAPTYDLMVGLSPGYHAQLRLSADALVASLVRDGRPERRLRVLDLGCGSGASTAALVDALDAEGLDAEVVAVDGSAGMLAQARRKSYGLPVDFRRADGEVLTAADLGGDVDAVLAAYLFRNVAARDRLLAQVLDLLRPGGVLTVHDYCVRGSRTARRKWDAVCWGVIVPLGLMTAPRSPIYRYLWRSVIDFDSASGFRDRLSGAGYEGVRSRTFRGWQQGVLHTFQGTRPGGDPVLDPALDPDPAA